MDPGALRLLISRGEAKALLGQQIVAGGNLRKQIVAAVTLADLEPLSGEISVWSARNEAILVRAFGREAGQRYRLGAGAAVAVRGFGQRQAEMVRRVEAGLRRLRNTAAALDLAAGAPPPGSGEQSRKRRWRAAFTSPWTVAICAPLIGTMILAGVHLAGGTAAVRPNLVVTGSVVCDSGRPVVGVWIAAATSESDSGMADLGASGHVAGQHPGSEATYTYLLRHGGTYSAPCIDEARQYGHVVVKRRRFVQMEVRHPGDVQCATFRRSGGQRHLARAVWHRALVG